MRRTLPGAIVLVSFAIGDWLVVRNQLGDIFVVDPSTGAEAVIAPGSRKRSSQPKSTRRPVGMTVA